MVSPQAFEHLLHAGVECVIRGTRVHPHRVSARWGQVGDAQDGDHVGLLAEGHVGVPAVGLGGFVALVGDQLDLGVTFDVREELVLLHLAKILAQTDVGLGLQSLLAEKHHAVLPQRLFDFFVNVFRAGVIQVNAADHAADGGRHGVDLDVTEFHCCISLM